MKTKSKRQHTERLEGNVDFNLGIDEMIIYLHDCKERYPNHGLWFEPVYDYDGQLTGFELMGLREETDAEYEKRLKLEEEYKAKDKERKEKEKLKKEKKEKDLYLKLKKKFEK